MGKHTEGPWQIDSDGMIFGIDPTGRMQYIALQREADGSLSDEDKAHIVRCVNSHAAMVAALEDCIANLERHLHVSQDDRSACADRARATLALAKVAA